MTSVGLPEQVQGVAGSKALFALPMSEIGLLRVLLRGNAAELREGVLALAAWPSDLALLGVLLQGPFEPAPPRPFLAEFFSFIPGKHQLTGPRPQQGQDCILECEEVRAACTIEEAVYGLAVDFK